MNAYTAGDRIVYRGVGATVLAVKDYDRNALVILVDGDALQLDTRACFVASA